MKRFILSLGALTMFLMAVPAEAAILNVAEYNQRITAIHGQSFPKLWADGKVMQTYVYRYTLGNVVLERELSANMCGGYKTALQLHAIGIGGEPKTFGAQCRAR